MPRASVVTATMLNPGDLRNCRNAKRMSCQSRSTGAQPHASCVCSLMSTAFPKARLAAYRASSGGSPRSRCSSSSSSRSECSSRSRSASRVLIFHQRMSALLGGRPHYARHRFCHLLPLRLFHHELFVALFRQPVILELPLAVRRHLPLSRHPAPALEPVQRRIERPVLHLQKIVGRPLNML